MKILFKCNVSKAIKKLQTVERKLRTTILKEATRAGSRIIRNAVRRMIPKVTGSFRRAITVRALKRNRNRLGYAIFVNVDKLHNFTGRNFYPAFQEFGSKKRNIEAQHYFANAYTQNKRTVQQAMINYIERQIEAIK